MIKNDKYKKTNDAYVRSAMYSILCVASGGNASQF